MKRSTKYYLNRFLFIFIIFIILNPFKLSSYDNRGPHQMINRLALKVFWQTFESVLPYKMYNIKDNLPELKGESVIKSGMFYPWEALSGIESLDNLLGYEHIKIGDKKLNYQGWIEEGGYTADEPELWQALRHFYDPKNPDKPYLTDFKDWGIWMADKISSVFLGKKPNIDAISWGIDGPQKNDFPQNNYCWKQGVNYMRRAFVTQKSAAAKERLFAAAWRSLGETMHLLADMTAPAHVRNDSHPGPPVKIPYTDLGIHRYGSFKRDPYEYFLDAHTIRKSIYHYLQIRKTHMTLADLRLIIDKNLLAKIDAVDTSQNIKKLFQVVAAYTNKNFFSQDTFSGTLHGGKIIVKPGNKFPPYNQPKLQDFKLQGKYRYRKFPNGRSVYMAKRSFFTISGWVIDRHIAISQGRILIPVAIYANTKLLDWFIPRLTVNIETFDKSTGILSGKIQHTVYGVFEKPLIINKPQKWNGFINLYIDGKKQTKGTYLSKIENNEIKCDLKGIRQLDTAGDHTIEIEFNMGGIFVKSNKIGNISGSPWEPRGTSFASGFMDALILLPQDLGKMRPSTTIWSNYPGWNTIMTVTGEIKDMVYLREHYDTSTKEYKWIYALIVPPGIKSGTYQGTFNFYADGGNQGPYQVPINLKVTGKEPVKEIALDSNALFYLKYLLEDLNRNIEIFNKKHIKAKKTDIKKIIKRRADKIKIKNKKEVKQIEKNIDNTQKNISDLNKQIAELPNNKWLKNNPADLRNAKGLIEKHLKNCKDSIETQEELKNRKDRELTEKLGKLVGEERDLKQKYNHRIQSYKNILKELREWKLHICFTFSKYLDKEACLEKKDE